MQKFNLTKIQSLIKDRENKNVSGETTYKRFSETNFTSSVGSFKDVFNSRNQTLERLADEFPEYYELQGDRIHRVGSDSPAGISFNGNIYLSSHDKDPMQRKAYTLFDAICKLRFNGNFSSTINYLRDNKAKYSLSDEDFPVYRSFKNRDNSSQLPTTKTEEMVYENGSKSYQYGTIKVYEGFLPMDTHVVYLLDNGLFPEGGVSILSSPGGVGKSTLMAALVAKAVKNEPFASTKINYKGGKILLVFTEGMSGQYEHTFKKLNLTEEQRQKILVLEWKGIQKDSDFISFVDEFPENYGEEIEMVILDSLTGKSKVSDNDPEGVRQVFNLFYSVLKKYPTAKGIILHHPNKNKYISDDNIGKLNGSAGWGNASRQIILLTRKGKDLFFHIPKDNSMYEYSLDEQAEKREKKCLRMLDNFEYEFIEVKEQENKKTRDKVMEVIEKIKTLTDEQRQKIYYSWYSQTDNAKQVNITSFIEYCAKMFGIDITDISNNRIRNILNDSTNIEEKKFLIKTINESTNTTRKLAMQTELPLPEKKQAI